MIIETCAFVDLPPDMVRQARREGADLDQTLKGAWSIHRVRVGMETVGFIGTLHRSKRLVTLRGWYVAPMWRGQGVGGWLLVSALSDAIEGGAEQVEIRTARQHLVESFGFTWTGYQRAKGNREKRFLVGG